MAHAHNCLIRALNSIFLQAPHIPQSTEPGYVAQDVRDLLFYVTSWVKMVEFHHHAEETYVFPNIAAFTGKPGIMDGPVAQHKEFTAGLESLLDYAQRTTPEDYRWEGDGGMKAIIDAFVPSLMKHLYEEIDVCLGLDWVDSDGLMKCFKDAEKKAEGNSDFGMLVSCSMHGPHFRHILIGSCLESTMSSPVASEHPTRPLRVETIFHLCPSLCRMLSNIGSVCGTGARGGSTLVTSGGNLYHCIFSKRIKMCDRKKREVGLVCEESTHVSAIFPASSSFKSVLIF